ncbi:hypothetical protein [Streptomyces fulvoviolaceus]|uniref:hypothetical protein n=1 Tax=Streptomyces fulvoviolaceus TaxID=285535 RepID=UPI0004C63E21|nr:hypothetical protein [Streptomyces fulvoviolaceus]
MSSSEGALEEKPLGCLPGIPNSGSGYGGQVIDPENDEGTYLHSYGEWSGTPTRQQALSFARVPTGSVSV